MKQSGHWAVLLAALLWGTTGTVASFAPQVSALAIGAFAMGVGGLLQALLARRQLCRCWHQLLEDKKRLLSGGIAVAIYPLAFYSSMRMAGVAIGTVITIASAPFISALFERFLSQAQTLNRRWLFSLFLGVLGMVLLCLSKPATDSSVASDMDKYIGIGLGIIAGASYAYYSWVAKNMIDKGIRSDAAMGSLFCVAALILLPSLWFTGEQLFTRTTHILVISYMAFIPMFVGYLAFGYGLRSVSASSATLLTLFEPVVAAVLAVLVVGEVIPLPGWVGIGLICLCLITQSSEPRDRPFDPAYDSRI
ncbi:EamA family transporter [Vibrio sp. H11]|uniref:DMT family transporter n=1 Tax=Vibrio sp. H11 TaxID=2565928 RepID=UPI0010A68300|nr:EamA family transporter [Vibrio sp. H11]